MKELTFPESLEYPTYDLERLQMKEGYKYVVGVDEVGRGCGAGSVVAVACYLPPDSVPEFLGVIKDSKKMSAKRREKEYLRLVELCDYGIGSMDNNIIDEVNIRNATKMAMVEAISYLPRRDYLLVDGDMFLDDVAIPQKQVIKGDNISLTIACASVIAKVVRDNLMVKLHEEFPMYNWLNNKGYLTKDHITGMQEHGVTKYHRLSFNKVG